MQSTTVRTLAKMEFHETPHYYDGSPIPPAQLAANAKADYEDAKLKLNDAGGAYVAARNQGNLDAFKQAVVEVVAAAAAYKATAVDAAQSALADDAVADAQNAAAEVAQEQAKADYEDAATKINDAWNAYNAAKNQGNLDAFKQAVVEVVAAAAAYKATAVDAAEIALADNAVADAQRAVDVDAQEAAAQLAAYAKQKLKDAWDAYNAAQNQGNLDAFKQAADDAVAAAAAYKATAVDAAEIALADDAVADAQDAADTAAQLAAQLAAQAAADAAAQAAADAAAQAAAREGYETAKKKFNDAEKVYLAAQNQGNLDAFKQAADDEVVAAAAYKTAAVEVFERTAADNAIRGAADDKSKAYTAADAPPTGTAAPPPGTAPIISSASAAARGRTQPRAAGTMPSIVDAAIASRIAGQASSSLQQPMQPTHHPTTTSSPAVRPTRTASKATAPRATTAPSACGGASSGGIVDKVFSSMFGESACSPPASAASSGAAAAAASASAAGVVSTPPSPTHPSSGESGPRVFQRRQR